MRCGGGGAHENTYTSSHCKVYLIMFAKLWSLGQPPNSQLRFEILQVADLWDNAKSSKKWKDEIRFSVNL